MKEWMNHPTLKKIASNSDILMIVMLVLILLMIIVPLPAAMLDIFLTLNIALSVLIFLLAFFSKHVLDFSVFPSVLLVTTLFRLALNISSTRLILSTGDPGSVVTGFAQFVTQGDLIVGTLIFLIMIIVQFIVINAGATRVSEVGARFTLDAMPGKQMNIDMELNAGMIDKDEAKRRRERLQAESELYGAMDGASKFIKGDAVAGLIIVIINFIGGVVLFSMKGYDIMEAIQKFGLLTIGDGLVSQVASIFISVGAGIFVTRTKSGNNLGKDLVDQLFSLPKALAILSGVLLILAIIPGLPFLPFALTSIAAGAASFILWEDEKMQLETVGVSGGEDAEQAPINPSEPENIARFLQVRTFEIEFGGGLTSMMDDRREREIFEQITQTRRQIAQEYGLLVPMIHLRDNIQLGINEYRILVKGIPVASGEIYPNKYLVMSPDRSEIMIEGMDVIEPAYGERAKWIQESLKGEAELMGYTVVEDIIVLLTHLKEVIRVQAHELLGRQELKVMLDQLKDEHPNLVEDVLEQVLPLGDVLKVLKGLLKEGVSIRDLATILEVLAEWAPRAKNIDQLIEYARAGLSRSLALPYLNYENKLDFIALHPALENMLIQSAKQTSQGILFDIAPETRDKIIDGIQFQIELANRRQKEPVFMIDASIRPVFRRLIEKDCPMLPVVTMREIASHIETELIGMVTVDEL